MEQLATPIIIAMHTLPLDVAISNRTVTILYGLDTRQDSTTPTHTRWEPEVLELQGREAHSMKQGRGKLGKIIEGVYKQTPLPLSVVFCP